MSESQRAASWRRPVCCRAALYRHLCRLLCVQSNPVSLLHIPLGDYLWTTCGLLMDYLGTTCHQHCKAMLLWAKSDYLATELCTLRSDTLYTVNCSAAPCVVNGRGRSVSGRRQSGSKGEAISAKGWPVLAALAAPEPQCRYAPPGRSSPPRLAAPQLTADMRSPAWRLPPCICRSSIPADSRSPGRRLPYF
jgi:hypothetical protein